MPDSIRGTPAAQQSLFTCRRASTRAKTTKKKEKRDAVGKYQLENDTDEKKKKSNGSDSIVGQAPSFRERRLTQVVQCTQHQIKPLHPLNVIVPVFDIPMSGMDVHPLTTSSVRISIRVSVCVALGSRCRKGGRTGVEVSSGCGGDECF